MVKTWNETADILVFGSGAAGLSAAIYAKLEGLSVKVFEKSDKVGGTTATSGGIVWAPRNHLAVAAGVDDSKDDVRAYLENEFGEYNRPELTEAFIEAIPYAIDALHNRANVKFSMANFPDYHADQPGARDTGRALEAQRFDGRKLGKNFALVRPPLPSLMLLGGMQVDKRKVDDFLNPFSSFATLSRIIRAISRYAVDRLQYPRGTELCAGNALVAALLHSGLNLGVEVNIDSPLVDLVHDEGVVIGALVKRDGVVRRVRARKGVILATGGFPASKEMRERYSAHCPHDITFGFSQNVGDGVNAAMNHGAKLDTHLASTGYWQPSSKRRLKDGTEVGVMYGYLDRGRPGVIAIDRDGKRFVNEANSYHDVGLSLIKNRRNGDNYFYFVCDKDFVFHHGLGMIRPFRVSLSKYIKSGYIIAADTIKDLAIKINVDPNGLAESIAKNNLYAITGKDLDFGKGSTAYNRLFGHKRAIGPNKNIAKIEKAPFIALRIYPGTLGTAVGVKTSGDCEVLDSNNLPIKGLYACGNDMGAVMRGCYPGGGITLGPALAFPWRAIQHAAHSVQSQVAVFSDEIADNDERKEYVRHG